MPFVVEVTWNDACVRVGETLNEAMEDFKPGIINRTVGWYVGVKESFIVIAEEWCEESDDYRGITSIPLGDIQDVRQFGKGKTIWSLVKQSRRK